MTSLSSLSSLSSLTCAASMPPLQSPRPSLPNPPPRSRASSRALGRTGSVRGQGMQDAGEGWKQRKRHSQYANGAARLPQAPAEVVQSPIQKRIEAMQVRPFCQNTFPSPQLVHIVSSIVGEPFRCLRVLQPLCLSASLPLCLHPSLPRSLAPSLSGHLCWIVRCVVLGHPFRLSASPTCLI